MAGFDDNPPVVARGLTEAAGVMVDGNLLEGDFFLFEAIEDFGRNHGSRGHKGEGLYDILMKQFEGTIDVFNMNTEEDIDKMLK